MRVIEKLDIARDDEETNIVNGFDDSIRHDDPNSNFNEIDTYEALTSCGVKNKSRNYQSTTRNSKPKGIKTMLNFKDNTSSRSKNFHHDSFKIGTLSQNWEQSTIENVQSNNSFAINQNHLHLHVNVTNTSDFKSIERNCQNYKIYDDGTSEGELTNIKGMESSRTKSFIKEKFILTKNNMQYTPLTINGILKDHSKLKNRIKTKSNDMSNISLNSF